MSADQPTASDLYRAAQDLIRSGQPVFPCKASGPKAKAPLTVNGFLDATTDQAVVKQWWKQYRDAAAIGIPTGIVWDVLDVDVKADGSVDGRVHLHRLNRLGLLNGCKRVVRTPRGGYHLYFKAAPGLTNKAHATLGLDIRVKGGYVLAPPSYLSSPEINGAYVDMGETEGSTDDPLLWDLIVNSLAPVNTDTRKPIVLLEMERRASLAHLRGWLSERQAGERNNALHWTVMRCIENGIDPNELLEVALAIGLDEDETTLTISSALRRSGVTANDLSTEGEYLFPGDD